MKKLFALSLVTALSGSLLGCTAAEEPAKTTPASPPPAASGTPPATETDTGAPAADTGATDAAPPAEETK